MEDLLEEISKLIAKWLALRGYVMPEHIINAVLVIIFCSTLFSSIYNFFKWLGSLLSKWKTKKDLHPLIDKKEVNSAIKFYVETKGQNVSPGNESEPKNNYAFTLKKDLIPFYIKAIKDEDNDIRHYLILADSGMGKSTFLINMYLKYTKIFFPYKYKMKLIPLAYPDADKLIEEIQDQSSTILLLDGLDEDPQAWPNYRERIEILAKKTYKFRKIFLTSRTQFFPSESKEPHETGLFKYSQNEDTQHYFRKIYLSPFDDNDVNKYLGKKYPFYLPWKIKKRIRANQIVALCPYLMVRPMLLSYIDSLVDDEGTAEITSKQRKRSHLQTSDIYETLIERWIVRESKRIEVSRRDHFIKNMYKFSEDLALFLFTNNKGKLTISKEDAINFASTNQINLTNLELTGKSLLNRDANGDYKFAHKSILEFFLATHAVENKEFGEGTLYFSKMEGYDQASKFCSDLILEKSLNQS